jgi:DNA-directed RNA polymerase specialized sigma24 family protein
MNGDSDLTNKLGPGLGSDLFWQEAVQRFWAGLVAWFARKCPGAAEDLAQETLLKAWGLFKLERWQHLPPPERLRVCGSYLWQTAWTVAADHHRKLRKESSDAETVAEVQPLVQRIQQLMTRDDFKKVMDLWSAEDAWIVSRRLADSIKFSEITEEVNIERGKAGKPPVKESGVRMRFKRAIKKLGP